MATSLQTLIPLLSSIALLLTLANTAQSLGENTTFSHNFFSGQKPTDLTYQGDAHFPSDTAVLRLTKTNESGIAQPYSIGRVIHSKPVIFSEKNKHADFKSTVNFIIRSDYYTNPRPADGLVFFIAPFNSTFGGKNSTIGDNFGVFDPSGKNTSVFAVEFDVYVNRGVDIDYDPRFGNVFPHVGIDIQSHKSSNVSDVVDEIVGQEVTALIAYDATTKSISVHGNAGAQKFEVSYVYDLSTILPQQVQVGISAATGYYVAVHDVISWSFDSALVHKK